MGQLPSMLGGLGAVGVLLACAVGFALFVAPLAIWFCTWKTSVAAQEQTVVLKRLTRLMTRGDAPDSPSFASSPKKCGSCGKLSPASASVCDCGQPL